jgi:hypothetical protein
MLLPEIDQNTNPFQSVQKIISEINYKSDLQLVDDMVQNMLP